METTARLAHRSGAGGRGRFTVAALLLIGILCASAAAAGTTPSAADTVYVLARPTADGIGKLYHGREISRIMGHLSIEWLERREREDEERPELVVTAMDLAPDAVVADIGAGSGYFTFRLAARVPHGRVYAVDVQPEMLRILQERMARDGHDNIVPILGREDDPRLPAGAVDAVLLVDAYHEFAYPFEMMRAIVRALRPGGRVFLVEYRGEDPDVPIKPLHKMTQRQAIREMEAVGLRWKATEDILPTQHFMVFEKPDPEAGG